MTEPVDLAAWWSSYPWHREVRAWIADRLAERGIRQTGPPRQSLIRFWSTTLAIPTDAGTVWFKENNPGQRFEATLVATLADLVPDNVLTPLAVDHERGWLLAPDGGPVLADTRPDRRVWPEILAAYGRFQRRLEGHGERILAAGVSAAPAGGSAAYAAERLAQLAALPPADPRGLGTVARERWRAGLPGLAAAAAELAASGIRDSLQHNDFHSYNVFAPTDGKMRFFDFGDALWTHPFAVVMVPRGAMARLLRVAPDDPLVRRAEDAYLENWSDVAPSSALRALLPAADRLAGLHRAISWRRLLDQVPITAVPADWHDSERWWLMGGSD